MKSLHVLAWTIAISGVAAAQGGWKWSGSFGEDAVELLILGDIQVQRRAEPASVLYLRGETLLAHRFDSVRLELSNEIASEPSDRRRITQA